MPDKVDVLIIGSGASGAAAKLGIPPSTLDSKIAAFKINKHQFKKI